LRGASLALGLLTVAWPLAWAPAITSCAFSRAGAPVLAAEGVFILAYLITAQALPGLGRPATWLRHQVRPGVAGLIASGAVLAALALHQPNAAWLSLAGLTAAVAAYLIALPRRRA
jgi:hypothetical protein